MSEYRYDLVHDHWVILAPNRNSRPDEFVEAGWKRAAGRCPFCAGHEQDTPPELARYTLAGRTDWQVRVVPNKYPAVVPSGTVVSVESWADESLPGYGWHEVIIESPQHVVSWSEMELEAVELVLAAYQDRLKNLRDQPQVAYAALFKNVGAAAGASIEHAHSQLLATTLLPPPWQIRLARWRKFYYDTNLTVVGQWLQQEQRQGCRLVAADTDWVAVCPFASRVPFEVRVAPRRPAAYFEQLDARLRRRLAALLQRICRRLEAVAPGVAYNVIVHTAPFDPPPHDYFHWYVELLPRLTRAAGFEWGTGCFINPVEPERAAALLKAAEPTSREIR
ncbi:MAG: galactose-1-phosphate uridylyltransferase [Pirellulaceae bacterium]|nr:MAG: galactose-1-phosphate uridylyltransferase [Pirellulaceae bacterium]